MERYKVVKNISRGYGYALQDTQPEKPGYSDGPQHTMGWYKYKRDAVARAKVLNAPVESA